jgi:hypothetical protein
MEPMRATNSDPVSGFSSLYPCSAFSIQGVRIA